MHSLAGHKGSSIQLLNAASAFFSRDVFTFVKGGAGASTASPLDPAAKVVRRSFVHGDVSAKNSTQRSLVAENGEKDEVHLETCHFGSERYS